MNLQPTPSSSLSSSQRNEVGRTFAQVAARSNSPDGVVTKEELVKAMGGDFHVFEAMDVDHDQLVDLANFTAFVEDRHRAKGDHGDAWLHDFLYTLQSAERLLGQHPPH